MLTNFAKGSIINVLQGLECASECNSIKPYKKVGQKLPRKIEISTV